MLRNPWLGPSDNVFSASEAIEGLIAAQIRAEVKIKMDLLEKKRQNSSASPRLCPEISEYLRPWDSNSRQRIVKTALEKMEDIPSTADLAAKISEVVELAILEVLHKGIHEQMRSYMK